MYLMLRKYHVVFFLYILIVFSYYYENVFIEIAGRNVSSLISYIGNIILAVLAVMYAQLIAMLNERENTRGYKLFAAGNFIYVIIWVIGVGLFRSDADIYQLDHLGVILIYIAEFAVASSFLYFVIEQWKDKKKNTALTFFLVVFLIEFTWEIMYDLGIVLPALAFTHASKPFNLVTIVYFVVNVTSIWKIYGSSGLWLGQSKEMSSQKIEMPGTSDEMKQDFHKRQIERSIKQWKLTAREEEVLHLVLAGRSNQEIAEELYISSNTVKHHMASIFKKADVNKRVQLAQKIYQEIGENDEKSEDF